MENMLMFGVAEAGREVAVIDQDMDGRTGWADK